MRDDFRYDAALSAALDLVQNIEAAVGITGEETLAMVTYAILDAIYDAERRWRAGNPSPASPAGPADVLQCPLRCDLVTFGRQGDERGPTPVRATTTAGTPDVPCNRST